MFDKKDTKENRRTFWNGCNMKIKTLEKSRVLKAGDGNRTHVSSLEGWCSTIELHPHVYI